MVVTKYSAQDTGLVCGTVGAVVIDDSSVAWEDRWAGCQPARSPSTELNLCAKRVREHVGRFGVLMVSSMRGTSQTLKAWVTNYIRSWSTSVDIPTHPCNQAHADSHATR
ncbi:hypothetical protein PISMIDRAFT_283662 [Pisolithus microcarpus 441]|uniref:Uncharacterized protein n=1 Tax=Pisolithus microcarpus 441 TaxID=765257 RepID=A0A0D0A223_9AGAM|nr:hypothetical protein PISMIDRAFT_283662 [Pisolithus microcarpus 441]